MDSPAEMLKRPLPSLLQLIGGTTGAGDSSAHWGPSSHSSNSQARLPCVRLGCQSFQSEATDISLAKTRSQLVRWVLHLFIICILLKREVNEARGNINLFKVKQAERRGAGIMIVQHQSNHLWSVYFVLNSKHFT